MDQVGHRISAFTSSRELPLVSGLNRAATMSRAYITATIMKTPARLNRSKRNSATNGMIAPAMLPMPLTIEVPWARIEVGNTSGDQAARVVFSSMVKNWNVAPRIRINGVVSANRANATAVMQPRIAAPVTAVRRGARLARNAAAQAPSRLPMFMIMVNNRLSEME